MDEDELLSEINDITDRNKKNIENAIKKLDDRISIQADRLITAKKNGDIVAPSTSLAQKNQLLIETNKAFEEIYGDAVATVTNYADIDALNQGFLVESYNGTSVNSLKSLSLVDAGAHAALGDVTKQSLNSIFIDHVLNGGGKKSLLDAISAELSGKMQGRAGQIVQDTTMNYFAQSNALLANQLGITKFKYYGSLIVDSRDWCVDHVGKTFTLDEIKAFDDDTWAGKKPGSTLINRGGYSCRHNFVPIVS